MMVASVSCMTPQANRRPPKLPHRRRSRQVEMGFSLGQAAAMLVLAAILAASSPQQETISNIPPTLSGEDRKQETRIKHPKSPKALRCTSKCVTICIRGGAGAGAPGEGPLNVRSLAECSDKCNLIKDGEDGPG